ncbi:MAG: hypothetical protein CVV44_22900 [Spirochaetae bacterium HGW-Spirochaetae-1]|jgi:lipopolysaccharide export LptBFGC system permease protein LptF|nr:MAG: hypothetical protein CVV44_22900 [Spirochaetae bacterium HGW-Spirochaetae-1]
MLNDIRNNKVLKAFLAIIVAVVVILFLVKVYLGPDYGKVKFVISAEEISNPDDIPETDPVTIKDDNRLYFSVTRNKTKIKAENITLAIEVSEGDSFRSYKKISYEVEKKFKKLNGYIPEVYFKNEGKYRIILQMDGNQVVSREFTVD